MQKKIKTFKINRAALRNKIHLKFTCSRFGGLLTNEKQLSMSRISTTLFIILWSIGDTDPTATSEKCGISGMFCEMDCRQMSCSEDSRYGYWNRDVYVCSLESIDFPGSYNSTNLDLSNISLALNRIGSGVFNELKMHILSLNLSMNVFCRDDYEPNSQYNWYSDSPAYNPVADVLENFPSLRSVDLSSTIRKK